jgi:hypothetical protein
MAQLRIYEVVVKFNDFWRKPLMVRPSKAERVALGHVSS